MNHSKTHIIQNKSNPSRVYICIDLKSFYASVECLERKLNPLTTNLLVADESRTDKTICLAVSPALKTFGVPGRPRLFQARSQIQRINAERAKKVSGRKLTGKSTDYNELKADPSLAVDFIIAKPRMAYYMKYSTKIYQVYLQFVSHEDIHVYSIDEVFIDVTNYLSLYKLSPHDLAMKMIQAVLNETGITATAGIGPNMYLAKIAMDIEAKHIPADENGVRIAELDEISYREKLWSHKPITDFWRVGKGYAKRLEDVGLFTMGEIARCSINNEELLYRIFGINAELLIDHAWGEEPARIKDIKAYKPETNCLSSGQVLRRGYTFDETRIVIKEMADDMALNLVSKKLMTNQLVLHINYDRENLTDEKRRREYHGKTQKDYYGREVPIHAHGTHNLKEYSSSANDIIAATVELFDKITDPNLLIRRLNLTVNRVIPEADAKKKNDETKSAPIQLNFFTNYKEEQEKEVKHRVKLSKERNLQDAVLKMKEKYGKNAIIKGMNMEENATGIERNDSIGGHHA